MAKSLYFTNSITATQNNMKKTWTILNKARNKTNTKPRLPDCFNIISEYITDKATIATEFYKYFAEIGETIISVII